MLVAVLFAASSFCLFVAIASEACTDQTCSALDAPETETEALLQMFQSSHLLSPASRPHLLNGAGALAKDTLDLEDALLEDDATPSSSECQQRATAEPLKAEGNAVLQRIVDLLHMISDLLSLLQDIAWFAVGFAAFLIWRGFMKTAENLSKPKEIFVPKPKEVSKLAKTVPTTTSVLEVDALVRAMYSENKDDLRKFLDARSVNACDDACCCTALHVAAHYSCLSAAEALLARGADVNVCDVWDETPLHFAARAGNGAVCSLLLNGRADANTSNVDGFTPLIVAASAKQADVCELLLDHGAHTGGADEDEVPPLLHAILTRRIICGATQATEDA